MKFMMRVLLVTVLTAAAVLPSSPASSAGTTYYVNNTHPSCNDSGPATSSSAPWCSLTRVTSGRPYGPGDSILLARGATWAQSLDLTGSGTSAAAITVGAYGTGSAPKITNTSQVGYGVRVTNGSYWTIRDLEVDGTGTDKFDIGVMIRYNTVGNVGLTLSNLYVHHNRHGIDIGGSAVPATGQWAIKGVTIAGVEGTHNERSIALSSTSFSKIFLQDVLISKVYLHHDDGAPAPELDCRDTIAMQSVTGAIVTNSVISYAGGCYAPAGTTSIYFGHTANVTVLNNIIVNTTQTGSPDQSGIVYQANTTNTAVRGNYIGGHPRWGVEVLGINEDPMPDHTGVVIDSNAIVFNGQPPIGRFGSNQTASGTIDRNLWQGTSFTAHDGTTFAGFTIGGQGPNPGSVTGDRVWYAARDFATGQGYEGWRYEYSANTGSSWVPLSYISAGEGWRPSSGAFPMINKWDWAPGGSTWAARAWTAGKAGTIAITGQAAKTVAGGDGIRVRVLKNNTTILSPITIGGSDRIGRPTALASVSVAAGDVIRFVVDSGSAGENSYDTVNWSPVIGYL